jgi:hypothetical protein
MQYEKRKVSKAMRALFLSGGRRRKLVRDFECRSDPEGTVPEIRRPARITVADAKHTPASASLLATIMSYLLCWICGPTASDLSAFAELPKRIKEVPKKCRREGGSSHPDTPRNVSESKDPLVPVDSILWVDFKGKKVVGVGLENVIPNHKGTEER